MCCENAAVLFNSLHNELAERFPNDIDEANELQNAVEGFDIKNAEVGDIWSKLWDKPLFGGINVNIANQWRQQLADAGVDNFENWPNHNGEHISDLGQNENITVPDFRLQSIVNAHSGLQFLGNCFGDAPLSWLGGLDFGEPAALERCANMLSAAFGGGWGPITVLHFLTDCGLAVKPDIHLGHSLVQLGLLNEEFDQNNPSHIFDATYKVLRLQEALHLAGNDYGLRYLDKILMQFSQRNLI